jgi:hypothetical protein
MPSVAPVFHASPSRIGPTKPYRVDRIVQLTLSIIRQSALPGRYLSSSCTHGHLQIYHRTHEVTCNMFRCPEGARDLEADIPERGIQRVITENTTPAGLYSLHSLRRRPPMLERADERCDPVCVVGPRESRAIDYS